VTDAERYFEMAAPVGAGGATGSYVDWEGEVTPVELVPGLVFRPVVAEGMMVNFVRYEPGTVAPNHAHAEEQITFVVEGEMEFDLDGDVRTIRTGTAVVIPPGVPHGARTLESRCFEIDVFRPPRQALLDVMAAAGGGPVDG
jgi:quercetin dioxygenase-like cupin family protein